MPEAVSWLPFATYRSGDTIVETETGTAWVFTCPVHADGIGEDGEPCGWHAGMLPPSVIHGDFLDDTHPRFTRVDVPDAYRELREEAT